jgi:hypothetical protein
MLTPKYTLAINSQTAKGTLYVSATRIIVFPAGTFPKHCGLQEGSECLQRFQVSVQVDDDFDQYSQVFQVTLI